MSDYLQKSNITYQQPNYNENEKDKVVNSDRSHGVMVSLDTTAVKINKIVVLDYTSDGRVVRDLNVSNKSNIENIYLREMKMSNENIMKTVRETLMSKIVDGYVMMKDKDTVNLDKLIGLACIAMDESEKNNQRLRTRNSILENKCADYDRVVGERDRLKSELDRIATGLCLALDRRIDDGHSIMHLINVCAALNARESEYRYFVKQNDKLKYALNEQRVRIRTTASKQLDDILNALEKLQRDLTTKDLKSRSMDDMFHSVGSVEDEKTNGVTPKLLLKPDRRIERSDGMLLERHRYEHINRRLINEISEYHCIEQLNRTERDEYCTLKNRLSSAEAEIENLKCIIVASDCALKEKNKAITRLVDAEVDWKKEVLALEKELKLKSAQIILTERIAKFQLKEACNNIRHLI